MKLLLSQLKKLLHACDMPCRTCDIAITLCAALGSVETPIVRYTGRTGLTIHILYTHTFTALHVAELAQRARGIALTT